ncbi:MAG: iron transporter [Clostridia bacterium]|nr:iron transporter [Clostridia bacterium]
MKKVIALLLAAMMLLAAVSALAEEDKEMGFEETPILLDGTKTEEDPDYEDETDVGELHIAAVYFQPVQMEPADQAGLTVEESNIHLEADIHWNKNEVGFDVGAWVPYLTVDYKITSETDGSVAAEGSFMVMSADDGPHYGANVKLDKSDVYTLTFTIHNPAENGYLLHVDEETGVTGRFWEEPIVVDFVHWEYTVQEW